MKQANMNRGKGNKIRQKNQNNNIFQKGLMDKNKRNKMELWKGGQKENKETKHHKKKIRILKTDLLGTQKNKKKSKIVGE